MAQDHAEAGLDARQYEDVQAQFAALWAQISEHKAQISEHKAQIAHLCKENGELRTQMRLDKMADTPVSSEPIQASCRPETRNLSTSEVQSSDVEASQVPDAEEDEEDELEIEGSAWQVCLLIGTPAVGTAASAYLVVLLVLNAVVQGIFCMVVIQSLSVPGITAVTVDGLRSWRTSTAHEYKNYNSVLGLSMAARVCMEDSALESSASQAQLFTQLKGYIGESDANWLGNSGPMMTTMALFMWLLTVSKEINAIISFQTAVTRKFLGARGEGKDSGGDIVTVDEEGFLVWEKIGWVRFCFISGTSLLRLCVSIIMVKYGSDFLVHYSIALGDILLNAVALEFVMSVDELVFETLAPACAIRLFPSSFGFKTRKARTWHGLDARAPLTFAVAIAIMMCVLALELQPLMETLVKARDALCAGDTDFVYTVDGLGVLSWAYPSTTNTSTWSDAATVQKTGRAPRNFPDGQDPTNENKALNVTDVRSSSAAGSRVELLLRQLGRQFHQETCLKTYEDAGKPGSCLVASTALGIDWFVPNPVAAPCCFAEQYKMGQVDAGRFSVKAKSLHSIESAVELWNPTCADSIDWPWNYRNMLQEALADAIQQHLSERSTHPCSADPNFLTTLGKGPGRCGPLAPLCALDSVKSDTGKCVMPETCASAKPWCYENSIAGIRARQLCPLICGCSKPRSPQALSLPYSGCGSQCAKSGDYLDALQSMPCTDVAKDDPAFVAFLDNAANVAVKFPRDWNLGVQLVYGQLLRQFGCDFLAYGSSRLPINTSGVNFAPYSSGLNFCVEGGVFFPIKPLSFFCPVACGCKGGDAHCPRSCPKRTPATPICESHQRVGSISQTCPTRAPVDLFNKNASA